MISIGNLEVKYQQEQKKLPDSYEIDKDDNVVLLSTSKASKLFSSHEDIEC